MKFPYQIAYDTAMMFCANLAPFVMRYAITGALRRIRSHLDNGGIVSEDWGLPKVEVLVIPKTRSDFVVERHTLFGDEGRHEVTDELLERIDILGYKVIKADPDVIKLWIPLPQSAGDLVMGCELHICREDNWGYMIAKTTGPAEMWERLAGMLPEEWSLRSDRVDAPRTDTTGKLVTEMGFFDFIGVEYVPPHERKFLGTEREPV